MIKEQKTASEYLTYDGKTSQKVSGAWTMLQMLVVFIFHCLLQFVLYAGQANHWPLFTNVLSAIAVLVVPNIFSITAYCHLLNRWSSAQPWPRWKKLLFTFGLTLVVQFFSWWASMLTPINTYGT